MKGGGRLQETHYQTKSYSRNRKLTFRCLRSVLASEPFILLSVNRSSTLELTQQGKERAGYNCSFVPYLKLKFSRIKKKTISWSLIPHRQFCTAMHLYTQTCQRQLANLSIVYLNPILKFTTILYLPKSSRLIFAEDVLCCCSQSCQMLLTAQEESV